MHTRSNNLMRRVIAAVLCLSALSVRAAAPTDLTELSLQELTHIEVTTLSKRPQRASDTAAALFVITQDDIRRAGATSIPDALRLAPGLQVARIDGTKWSISARGFSGRFANKLLVLMDGRTLYTETFGGVYWNLQDTLIDDIERIEIIRGPAGTTWGTNAINGIINIITKGADQTDGVLFGGDAELSADEGPLRAGTFSARIGHARDARTQWRVYAKTAEADGNEFADGSESFDGGQQHRAGGRIDHQIDDSMQLRLAAEVFQGHSHVSYSQSYFTHPSLNNQPPAPALERFEGGWALGRWSHTYSDDSRVEVQTYVDHTDTFGPVLGERRDTLDIELQHSMAARERHTITWGLGARHTRSLVRLAEGVEIESDGDTLVLGSAYLQDEARFMNDRLVLTAGARAEDTNHGSLEFLPNLRGHYAVSETAGVWVAAGRGLRRPARMEQDLVAETLEPAIAPGSGGNPFSIPVLRSLRGSDGFEAEELIGYDAGWRWQPGETLSLDVSLFHNEYDHLRTLIVDPVFCLPGGQRLATDPGCVLSNNYVMVPGHAGNTTSGSTRGGELTARWAPTLHWRITASYSHLQKRLHGITHDPNTFAFVAGQDPEHQWSLRSSISFGPRWDCDVFARYRGAVDTTGIGSATEVDARIAWRPTLDVEIALTGRNLLEGDSAVQGVSELYDVAATAIERHAWLHMRWSFR